MIQNITFILKRFFKIILWITGSVILLLLCIALFIQIPAVQNALLQKTTSYLVNKTHTQIQIQKIALAFPTSVSLQGILIKDLQHDTLLRAGEIKINIDMFRLIKKEVILNKVYLSETTVKIKRAQNDSLFNFNFLIAAFSDPTKKSAPKDSSAKKNQLTVKEVELEKIHFLYDDQFSGIYTSQSFSTLKVSVEKLDLNKQQYRVDKLELSGLHGQVMLLKKPESSTPGKDQPLQPYLSANHIEIKNSVFSFIDKTVKQSVSAVINNLTLTNSSVDLNSQEIKSESILLAQSSARVNMTQKSKDHEQGIPKVVKEAVQNGWKVSVRNIELQNNDVGYNITNILPKNNTFDANHINYKTVSLKAHNFYYSTQKLFATVTNFSALDPVSFEVKEFSTQFLMTPTSIEANNIHLKTENSNFNGNGKINFASLQSISDSLQNLGLFADIKSSSIYPFEILYFAPQLIKIPFFNNNSKTSVTGIIKGKLGDLRAQNLKIRTAGATALNANVVVKGLPDFKTSFFDIHDFVVVSGRADLFKLVGENNFPKNVSIPEHLSVQGKFKGFLKDFITQVDLKSDYGNAYISGSIDKQENFKGTIHSQRFDLGSLLKNKTMYGPVTLTANINGNGLDTQTVKANVDLNAPEFYLNKYTYHNLLVNGTFSKKLFEGKVNLNDSNAVLDLDGYVNLNPGQEQYKVHLDLKGADLKKLNLTEKDLKIGFSAVSDMKGRDMNTMNGTAGITRIIISSKGEKYILDSLIFASINQNGKSEMNLSSAIIGIKYRGTFAPGDLIKELKQNLNSYFPIEVEPQTNPRLRGPQQFSFEVQVNNHPILSEVFFPELKEFEPGIVKGSFNSEKKQLDLDFAIDKLIYKDIEVSGFSFIAASDSKKLTYQLKSKKIANTRIKFDNVLVDGRFEDQHAYTNISSTEENGNKKLVINSQVIPQHGNYKLNIDPKEFFIMNEQWTVSSDNYLLFGKDGILAHNLALTKTQSEIIFNTPSNKPDGDLYATLKNFKLDDLSRIIEKDTGLVKGTVNGDIILKKIQKNYGFKTDLKINELSIHDIALGDLSLKADNETADKFNVNLSLKGSGNNVTAQGYYSPGDTDHALNMQVDIKPLTAQSLEALTFGKVRECSGNLYGNFNVKGNPALPEVTGSLYFENVTLTPSILNSSLHMSSETVKVQADGLYFNSFTMLDKNKNPAIVDGHISMKQFKDFKFALTVNTTNFLLLNTTVKDNQQYFGTMIIDSKIKIKGTPDYPVINSSIKLKNGSNFTFAVTETKLTTDKGENIVLFVDSMKFNPILTRNERKEKKKSTLRNYDISSTIEIDKKASIRLMLDPGTSDSLVVRGDAALSFGLDPSGKISLTGVYNLSEGSYVVSLENVIKKKFKIEPGSTITWNGDPLDAVISINATYNIRTSPIDLVIGQVSGAELGSYRQRYAFQIFLKLRGAILTPEISFEIQLQQGDKGAAGGTINAKLEQLNDNPSALNKQVFALLVLNRFIQENPLQTETDAGANAARTTVGKVLSAQLNQLSSKVAPGVDINFDVQSYDDYSSGKSQGRTQVGVGVSKQLFNERVSVQVGGAVDVEGEKAKQNNATDITGDVIVEYKITKDGRYRLKGFRNNQYQGALEGQIIQTGAGVLYVRDFNDWIQLFTKTKKDTVQSPDHVTN